MIMLDYPSRANGCEGIVAQWMAFEDMLKSKKVSGCTTAPEQHAYDVDASLLLLMPLPPPPHVCCLPRTDGTKICCFCHRRFLTVCSSRMMSWATLSTCLPTYGRAKAKSLAVSNFSPAQLDCIVSNKSLTVPAVNQMPFSVGRW